MSLFRSTFEYKLIYIFRINDETHKGLLKIGETTCSTDKEPFELVPNCHILNTAAKDRINQYTSTAGIKYELLYTELAQRECTEGAKKKVVAFGDRNVHDVLKRSGIKSIILTPKKKQTSGMR